MSRKKKSGTVVSGTGQMRGITSGIITRSTPSSYHSDCRETSGNSCMRNNEAMSLLRRAEEAVKATDVRVSNEWNLLAMMIVTRAVADWNKLNGREAYAEYYQPITRKGLIQFFNSRWCRFLLECTDVTPEELMDAVGVPIK